MRNNEGSEEPTVVVGERFVVAVGEAVRLHAHQARKSTDVPYISHLLAVAGLVLEYGGDEDQAIAALLHDAPEDQGGTRVLALIRARFGHRVAAIVEGCSDTFEKPKPPWRPRKEAFLARLAHLEPDVWLVVLADKVHNARKIVDDLRVSGPATLDRFNGGRDGTLWYYGTGAAELTVVAPGPLADELVVLAAEMRSLAER
jgi:(p)ppGpp synthase/HD superfamily hydrolase